MRISQACASLSALIYVDSAPFAGRGDCTALALLLADNTSSSKRPVVLFLLFVGCTPKSESPVSWASDFFNLTCTASRSCDQNSFSNDVRTWFATGYPPMVVDFDKLIQRLWFHV